MRTLPGTGLAIVAALAIAGLSPPTVSAQEAGQTAACTARVLPAEVRANNAAYRLAITLSRPIGNAITFEPARDSGITLAKPEDLPRAPMADESAPPPQPIGMANEGNRVTLWVSTVEAKAGTHAFTLIGPQGRCTGSLTVPPAG